jgi:hypothetical protein
MIKKHYSVFDTTSQQFLNPLVFVNHGDAIRWFTTVVNDEKKESNIAKYPTQFMLFFMYDMDDKTGMTGTWNAEQSKMDPQKTPQELIIGAACVEEQEKTFTVKQLVTMLKTELHTDNVINLADEAQK